MKNPHFVEQDDSYPTTFTLADFSPKFLEKRFDIFPLDVCAGRMREDKLKGALVLSPHAEMVPQISTI